jgi:hypothetical protein
MVPGVLRLASRGGEGLRVEEGVVLLRTRRHRLL